MQSDPPEPFFYLHVPFESAPGHSFGISGLGRMRLSVLGHSALLQEAVLSSPDPRMATGSSVVMQWLLFDPMPETTARKLFEDLFGRMPVMSFRLQTPIRIRSNTLIVAQYDHYNGPFPTLVPAAFVPAPSWGIVGFKSRLDGSSALQQSLASCECIHDHRLFASIDMYVSSRHESSPEAAFLKLVTILDYLAVESNRPPTICKWLDETHERAKSLNDSGLLSSINMLKKTSRRVAIKALIQRAGKVKGHSDEEISTMAKSSDEIYSIRSKLSHEGSIKTENLKIDAARKLVDLVIEAALTDLNVLNPS